MKKKLLIFVAFFTFIAVLFFNLRIDKKGIIINNYEALGSDYLCCNNFDGTCTFDDGFKCKGAFVAEDPVGLQTR